MNQATVFGRLAHTPELKSLPSGTKVATMSLATNSAYKNDQGEMVESTEWHNIKAFGRTAETMAQYLKGGDQILVDGKLQTSSWEDKDGGAKRYRTEIIVNRFYFGAKNMNRDDRQTGENINQDTQGEPDTVEYPEEDINPEDIPF